MGAATRHERLYRSLTVLYPRGFRAVYGEPMAQLFADSVRDVGARAWLRALPDLVRTVPPQRIEAVMSRVGSTGRVLALAFAVLGAVAVSTGIGGGLVPLLAVGVVAVLVRQRRLFASLAGERAPLRHALVQSWWAPVAGLLGLAMLLAGVGTVFDAHNLSGRIVGSSLLVAFGAGMMLGLARRPFDRTAGNALILLTTVPAIALWWLIVPAVAAVTVWVGVLAAGFDEPAVA